MFCTTRFQPVATPRRSASRRLTTSVPPPGGIGTTRLMGRSG
ncbi:hypothetical protein WJ972_30670 [Achromobacter insuavis]